MSVHSLDRIPVGDRDASTGSKLQLGKLDPRLLSVLVNSGSEVKLHTIDYLKNGTRLYPSRDKMNVARDYTGRKLSIEFYLNNDLEETDPIEVYDDDEGVLQVTYYSAGSGSVTLSEETSIVAKGSSSCKIQTQAGSYNIAEIKRVYSPRPDWSMKDYVSCYWYGQNTGRRLRFVLRFGAGWRTWDCYDNWTGWRRLVYPLRGCWYENYNVSDSDLNNIVSLGMQVHGITPGYVWYLDRMVADVGQWVKTEVHVPDTLAMKLGQSEKNLLIRMYHWDGSQYQCCTEGGVNDLEARYIQEFDDSGGYALQMLNGYKLGDMYGQTTGSRDSQRGSSITKQGRRRASPGVCYSGGPGASQSLTYSSAPGMLNRWGFSLKMPPDDGQDSSVGGISQTRLKLELNYV